ncbi:HPr family phosphocarrier protein [Sansalvadorimonas sp. 2012CJ34-2]|uniref:HPr family phosphocarrier protein n=1 Tax=Parendozoicomonas callyspongiae TaxID=2942213 RepID=A0ABT0PC79_9GAMM|nr:HPr family phosphocarrier protein [Sansalvadorimonas sp. 2012CJ34-2]MCL6268898.1 HPr family phosphocarrier protein [Sansalvadorimonas sp. 2012CJ34-2]
MIQEQLVIINKLGLHARAAAKFVGVASSFASSIRIGNQNKMVDGKSIMAVMMLAASKGTTLDIEVEGDDADQAYSAIAELVSNRFDENE